MTEPGNEHRQDAEPQPPPDSVGPTPGHKPAMDALVAASRINRGVVMDDYTELTNPEVGAIRKRVQEFLDAQDELPRNVRVSRSKIADAIGESKSTVSQVLSCKYPKGKIDGWRKRDDIFRKLDKFVALQAERKNSPERSGFAWTAVAEEINGVAKVVVSMDGIGAVWSPAGCGKSLTAEAMLSMYPGSVLLTVDDECHSVTTLLRSLTDALKLPYKAMHRRSMFRAVVEGLKDSKRLVMIDEAHQATMEMLNTARQLQDKARFPLLLLGLPSLGKMLLAGRGDDSKGATVYSRLTIVRDLTERCRRDGDRGEPLFSIEDIKSVFARSTLRVQADGVQWLQGLANLPEVGGLRACNNAVRLAIQVAKQKGESMVTLTLLQQVAQLLHGVQGARAIGNRIRQLRKTA